jgi:aspartyl-tRNA(Asn)/glutamyl-tRNA(Gln) amidotransferase subunit B
MVFEPVIGLEVHAELLTRSKMFCGCAVSDTTSTPPNTHVCEICAGFPGSLPVINARALEYALRVALALHCEIAATSVFARKNYFYPDLPKGFQISQYELPLATGGWLHVDADGKQERVGIRRVHLEEDTGKLTHTGDYSLIDYNRSGVPLLEIVSEPDMRSVEAAKRYAHSLRSILIYLGVNSGDMQKGVIRFEANVSLRERGAETLGVRTEIKNLNSFRALERSIAFEIDRQRQVLERGEGVIQETVGWDENREVTISQRGKEEAHDYRYFPEPDLPPLVVDRDRVEQIRSHLPELPTAKRDRFMDSYSLNHATAYLLTQDPQLATYFEDTLAAASSPPDKVSNWLTGELFALSNQASMPVHQSRVSPAYLAEVVDLVEDGKINPGSGKRILAEVFETGDPPSEILKRGHFSQVEDLSALDTLIAETLDANPNLVAEYLSGKSGLANWFFGQVMQATGGRANPQILRARLFAALEEREDRHRS